MFYLDSRTTQNKFKKFLVFLFFVLLAVTLPIFFVYNSPLVFLAFIAIPFLMLANKLLIFVSRKMARSADDILSNNLLLDDMPAIDEEPKELKDPTPAPVEIQASALLSDNLPISSSSKESEASAPPAADPFIAPVLDDQKEDKKRNDSKEGKLNNPAVLSMQGVTPLILSFLGGSDIAAFARVSTTHHTIARPILENHATPILEDILRNYALEIPNNEFVLDKQTILSQLKTFVSLYNDCSPYNNGDTIKSLLDFVRDYESNDPALFQKALSEQDLRRLGKDGLVLLLNKAVAVGNSKLAFWLMSPARGSYQVRPTRKMLHRAARSGHSDLVKHLLKNLQVTTPDRQTIYKAIASGNADLVGLLKQEAKANSSFLRRGFDYFSDTFSLVKLAIATGNVKLAQQAGIDLNNLRYSYSDREQLLYAAGYSRSIEMVELVTNQIAENDGHLAYVFKGALSSGDLPWVKTLIEKYKLMNIDLIGKCKPIDLNNLIILIRRSVGLDLVKWLVETYNLPLNFNPFYAHMILSKTAETAGSLDLMVWLTAPERGDQQLHPTSDILHTAVEVHNFAVARYLLSLGILPNAGTLNMARGFKNKAFINLLEGRVEESNNGQLSSAKPSTPVSAAVISAVSGRNNDGPLHKREKKEEKEYSSLQDEDESTLEDSRSSEDLSAGMSGK